MPRDPVEVDRDVGVGILPHRVVPAGTTRHGLVVGIDNYANERLKLRCAVADARALRDLMVDPECGCFPPENVQLLVDHEATAENIFRALARLRRQAEENDMVWIYYAGHAAVEDSAYWVTHDADVDDLFATALSNERIHSVLTQLRTRRVLRILDCCYAETTALMKNPTRQVVTASELFGRFEGHGIITLAASNGKQKSVELSELGHGAFTYFLAKGLRGEADVDNDGVVTADELWSYLRGKVTAVSGRAGNLQTPMLIGSMTHDMALTLNTAATANKRRLMSEIEKLVGLGADRLTTDEGRLCADVLQRGPRTEVERLLLGSLEELADGKLTQAQFRRWLQVAKPAIHTADAEARAAADAERARAETDARVKQEADARAKAEADARAKQEAEAWAKEEADARAKAEANARVRKEAEARAKAAADARAKEEADARAKEEAGARTVAQAERAGDAQRGADLRVDLNLTFAEAVWGITKDVKVTRDVPCATCGGNGARPGSKPEICRTCQGKGQVVHTMCPHCRGAGKTIKEPCKDCRGRGLYSETSTLSVTVPAGVDDGQTLRLAGKGAPGSATGHLYVVFHVQGDERFERDGEDVLTAVSVSFVEAALGGEVEVHTLDDRCTGTAAVQFKPGLQPDEVFVRRGQGIPRVGESGRGDHVVQFKVGTPTKLTPRQEKLMRELSVELRETGRPDKGGPFSRKK